ncbi:MAG: tRNA pseudouridine(55) synthase TruB [Luminiphilus sp.]|jgi:tRNA pseudouridine55 synthase|nr:tRNA pseudouridine(55) synthase TruB [Luminiphilus sp.]
MARRRKGRPVNGLLILDKPAGMSSNGALQRVKRLFGAAKAGHTGSLDPLATGVLPLCFGEATKFSQFLLDADKGYLSTFVLGESTDTADADGAVIARSSAAGVTREAIERGIEALTGAIAQVPPMYSALKVNGQPLYKRARAGEEVERAARRVEIRQFDLLSFTPGERAVIKVQVLCSKGTYIRALAEDLGAALEVPAHVSALRRCQSGPFDLGDGLTLEQMTTLKEDESEAALDTLLLPVDACLQHLPRVSLSEAATFYIRQGQPVVVPNRSQSGMVRIADVAGKFLGIGDVRNDGKLTPTRLLAQ